MERGQAHYTTSDSELIAYEIVSERIKSNSVEEAVLGASKKLKGGYACIIMSPRKLIGIRDPLGIKPLVIGKRDDDYILASESAAIESTGGKVIRDVEPGELIIISKNGISGNRSLCGARAAHCVFEYIYFARNDSVIDGIEVYGARLRSGKALSRINPVDADIVSGIPDSGIAAAKGYSEASSIPFAFIFHKNSYIGRSFIKPTQEERNISVKMKLNILKSEVKGKRIVLIDDSIVRGTTMKQIVKMLREAGAKEVHVRISSPPFLYPCFYGTDVPNSRELIASGVSREDICAYIGADSLEYLKIENFKEIVGNLPLCTACFDGRYPV